jgi:hypothetical protein
VCETLAAVVRLHGRNNAKLHLVSMICCIAGFHRHGTADRAIHVADRWHSPDTAVLLAGPEVLGAVTCKRSITTFCHGQCNIQLWLTCRLAALLPLLSTTTGGLSSMAGGCL